jgi:hypothetical protein
MNVVHGEGAALLSATCAAVSGFTVGWPSGSSISAVQSGA